MSDNGKDVAQTMPVPVLELVEFEQGEVGEMVIIDTPTAAVGATWLGTVSNGKELAEAMRLMEAMHQDWCHQQLDHNHHHRYPHVRQ